MSIFILYLFKIEYLYLLSIYTQILYSKCFTLSFTPDSNPSQVKKHEVIGCDWRPHNALPASVQSPPAVNSCGRYSHFQPQCHRSHTRAGFDMSATIAGVFEETESGERWGSRKGSQHHPFSYPASIPPLCPDPSFKWACAVETTSLGFTTGSAYNVDTSKTSKVGDTVPCLEWNQKCGI